MVEHREPGRARRYGADGLDCSRPWVLSGHLGLALAWGYLLAVFALQEQVFGFSVGAVEWMALTLGAWLASVLLVRTLIARGRLSWQALRGPILALWVSLLGLAILDVGYSAVLYWLGRDTRVEELAKFDRHSLIGEVYPRLYYPTDRNFRLHKPNYHVTVPTYGNFYSPTMLRSPTLTKEVLQAHPITININRYGLREQLRFALAQVYALGDSFTFGWGLDAAQSWVKVLEGRIGCPIYNLGVQDSSPKQELELLTYLLGSNPDAIRIDHLIWMIYEGNDLEDSYADASPQAMRSLLSWLKADTLLGPLMTLPYRIKDGAILTRLIHGRIRLGIPGPAGAAAHYEVDGVTLAHPLYHSPKFGDRLFYRPYLERLSAPADYVLDHPNRARLDRVFEQMRDLAKGHGFQVTVVLAPTAGRLQGRFYDDFPAVADAPHFLNYVSDLAKRMGFETVDLYRLMQPYAGERLLYFKDDDHWNRAGSALAADLIAREAFAGHRRCVGEGSPAAAGGAVRHE
jgi:SGNH hydrolase-like domain, acetyltransferase AlgX